MHLADVAAMNPWSSSVGKKYGSVGRRLREVRWCERLMKPKHSMNSLIKSISCFWCRGGATILSPFSSLHAAGFRSSASVRSVTQRAPPLIAFAPFFQEGVVRLLLFVCVLHSRAGVCVLLSLLSSFFLDTSFKKKKKVAYSHPLCWSTMMKRAMMEFLSLSLHSSVLLPPPPPSPFLFCFGVCFVVVLVCLLFNHLPFRSQITWCNDATTVARL